MYKIHVIDTVDSSTYCCRQALQAMNAAYSSKNLRYPLANLQSLLLFNSETAAVAECRHYGLLVADNMVHFSKGTFSANTKVVSCAVLDLTSKHS